MALIGGGSAAAQAGPDAAALRGRIERRFDVLPLRDGFVLRPKSTATGVRAIEVTDDAIALDGEAATGAELRRRLGGDADLILQLSLTCRSGAPLAASGTVTRSRPSRQRPNLLRRPFLHLLLNRRANAIDRPHARHAASGAMIQTTASMSAAASASKRTK